MGKEFCVYVIQNSKSGVIYIGCTSDLATRLKRHNKELSSKTSSFTSKNPGDWRMVYKEDFVSRQEAMKREKELKSSRGRKFIHNFLNW